MTWHRLTHPDHPAPSWSESLDGYAGWTVTARTKRPPGEHEDYVGGEWVVDAPARAVAARRRKLRSMHRDEFADHVAGLVIERLRAAGVKI